MSVLSAEKRAEIIRVRKGGGSKDACRKASGASWDTVSRVLYDAGLQPEPPQLPPSRRPAAERRRAQMAVEVIVTSPPPPPAPPVASFRPRPAVGDITPPPGSRDPFAGRGCPTCRSLVGCSCGAPKAARRLSRDEVERTPVRTDFRLADESARGPVKAINIQSPRAQKAFRARRLAEGLRQMEDRP